MNPVCAVSLNGSCPLYVKFSVVIPVFNKQDTVEQTLRSVLDQNGCDYELVVVDDGSTDRSTAVIQNMDDERIRLFSIPNSGPSAARNQSSGDWILFLDADDVLLDGAFDVYRSAISRMPHLDMLVGNFWISDGTGKTLWIREMPDGPVRNPFKAWFYRQIMPRAGAFICKKSFLAEHPYKEYLFRSEDTEFAFTTFREGKVGGINTPVMEYRMEYAQESKKKPPVDKDFKGHLSFDGKHSIWENICLYECYVEAKNVYPEECRQLYHGHRHRYAPALSYHIAFWWRYLKSILC